MKKIFSLVTVVGISALIACGPSAEEKAAAEKARQDSINAAMAQMAADSAAQASMELARQDSMMMVMRNDSIAKAEAEAAAKKAVKPKAKTPTPAEKKTEDAKKVTGGRGH